ncbi:MAG: hypothetical protein LBQ62_00330 [Candidatus Accumulibacter sp.]|jgi:hypothetical protein|nr:hypothetical protein [Accumulibacter sp.]
MTTFTLAGPDDDETLRALLRDNPMSSWVSMVATREPSFFAGTDRFGRDWAVIARQDGEALGMYTCSEQPVHLNGRASELGYLGGLRVAPRHRHRLRILRDGYASLRRFSPKRRPEFWYTAIATENTPARRLLEANLHGMPRYRPVNDLFTLALPAARGRRRGWWRAAGPGEMAGLCRFYNRHARRHQFSPVLTPERAARTGALFHVLDGNAGVQASMALWNQQHYKQVAASAYRPPLGTLLPLYNLYARLARRPLLPPVGQTLDQTWLAFLAVAPGMENEAFPLLEDALAICPTAVLTLGLHAGHAWLGPLARPFCAAVYRTCIYTVDFGEAAELDGRPAQPEAALL